MNAGAAVVGWMLRRRGVPWTGSSSIGYDARRRTRRSWANEVNDKASIFELASALFGDQKKAPQILFIVGAPGVGKGTVSCQLARHHDWQWVSAGELLRVESERDESIGNTLKRGGVVPASTSTHALLRHLWYNRVSADGQSMNSRWVIDGYPRDITSAMFWEHCGCTVWQVLALELHDDNVLQQRLSLRGRADDSQPGVRQNRISQHNTQWPLIKTFYSHRNLWNAIDASGGVDDVWKRVQNWLALTRLDQYRQ